MEERYIYISRSWCKEITIDRKMIVRETPKKYITTDGYHIDKVKINNVDVNHYGYGLTEEDAAQAIRGYLQQQIANHKAQIEMLNDILNNRIRYDYDR